MPCHAMSPHSTPHRPMPSHCSRAKPCCPVPRKPLCAMPHLSVLHHPMPLRPTPAHPLMPCCTALPISPCCLARPDYLHLPLCTNAMNFIMMFTAKYLQKPPLIFDGNHFITLLKGAVPRNGGCYIDLLYIATAN